MSERTKRLVDAWADLRPPWPALVLLAVTLGVLALVGLLGLWWHA